MRRSVSGLLCTFALLFFPTLSMSQTSSSYADAVKAIQDEAQ